MGCVLPSYNFTQSFLLLLIVLLLRPQNVSLADTTLLQTNLLFRHGDRAPTSPVYRKDPYDESNWKYGFDQLTDIGRKQHYRLGRYFRRNYTDFVKDHVDVKEIYVRSSDIDRCLVSAYSHLSGFYSNSTNSSSDLNLPFMNWQLVPVHSVPKTEDEVLAMDRPCKAALDEKDRALHSGVVQQVNEAFADFFVWLSGVTGDDIKDVGSTWRVSDDSFCEKAHNLTLPDWFNLKNVTCDPSSPIVCDGHTVYEILRDMLDLSFQAQYNSTKLHMFYGGPLLQEIKENFNRMANRTTSNATVPKYFIYSAHDSTVAATLSALNIVHPKAPPYTATLIFELHSSHDGEKVKLLYKPYTDDEMVTLLEIPGCESPCKLEAFTQVVEKLKIDDWDVACGNTEPTPPSNPSFQLTHPEFVAILVCSTIIVVLGLTTLICYIRRKRISHSYMPIHTAS